MRYITAALIVLVLALTAFSITASSPLVSSADAARTCKQWNKYQYSLFLEQRKIVKQRGKYPMGSKTWKSLNKSQKKIYALYYGAFMYTLRHCQGTPRK